MVCHPSNSMVECTLVWKYIWKKRHKDSFEHVTTNLSSEVIIWPTWCQAIAKNTALCSQASGFYYVTIQSPGKMQKYFPVFKRRGLLCKKTIAKRIHSKMLRKFSATLQLSISTFPNAGSWSILIISSLWTTGRARLRYHTSSFFCMWGLLWTGIQH